MVNEIKVDISIIIVSWNVRNLLGRCLQSVKKSVAEARRHGHNITVEIIVIDNASNDGSAKFVKAEFPKVRLIANNCNLGFAKANNQATETSRGRYLLLLNPDTEIIGNSLCEMFSFMEDQPAVSAIGPKLINADGSLQRSCRRFPTVWSAAMILLKLHNLFPMSWSLRRYYMWSFKHETIRQVDQLMGACILTRQEAVKNEGLFDERFFLWFEEVDFCKRLARGGGLVLFYPYATVVHHRSSGFNQLRQKALWRQWQFSKSCRLYFHKHHSYAAALFIDFVSVISLLPAAYLQLFFTLGWRGVQKRDL